MPATGTFSGAFIQGIAMSCLFVPLTTITMDPIPKEEMGNATSIFILMRNIGGSMGIAVSATLLARHRQMHTNILGAHVNPYDLQTQHRLSQLQAAIMARGSDATTAARRRATRLAATQRSGVVEADPGRRHEFLIEA